MTFYINPLFGQSNFDLALQANGGFDNFVSFLNNNNISDVGFSENKVYKNDSNNVINKLFTNIKYKTGVVIPQGLLNNDGANLLNNDGTPLLNNF